MIAFAVTGSRPQTFASRRAFTLVELIVVIGIISVSLATVGFAFFGRGTDGAALLAAQSTLASLVGATRTQAALHQTRAQLLIYATQPPTGDSEKYLRFLQVVREQPAGSNTWVSATDPVALPAGIFVVPPTVPATHLGTLPDGSRVTWPAGSFPPVSNLSTETITVDRQAFGTVYYLEFDADGRITTSTTKIAVSTAVVRPGQVPQFDNPSAIRGILLRAGGSITRANDANSF